MRSETVWCQSSVCDSCICLYWEMFHRDSWCMLTAGLRRQNRLVAWFKQPPLWLHWDTVDWWVTYSLRGRDALQVVCQSATDDTRRRDLSSNVDEMLLQVDCLDNLQRNPLALPAAFKHINNIQQKRTQHRGNWNINIWGQWCDIKKHEYRSTQGNTWTQSEFCTWYNCVRGQQPPKMYT